MHVMLKVLLEIIDSLNFWLGQSTATFKYIAELYTLGKVILFLADTYLHAEVSSQNPNKNLFYISRTYSVCTTGVGNVLSVCKTCPI